MVCSSPPEGQARWTVRLIAQEAVKRKLVPRVVGKPFASCWKATMKPWRKKCGGAPGLTGRESRMKESHEEG